MSNINFELYKIFYQVALYKNITRAANVLYISQPAVTQHLKKLEEDLGYKLFYRTRQGVEFTKEGEELFNNIRYSMECLENIKIGSNNIKEIKEISIGGGYSALMILIVPILEKIRQEFDGYNMKMLRETNQSLTNKILNNVIDIGLISSPQKFEEGIEYILLTEIENKLICGRKWEEYKNKVINLEELTKLPLILTEKDTRFFLILKEFSYKNNIELIPKYEISTNNLILELVKNNFGVGILHREFCTKELETGELIELKTDFDFPKRKIYIMINKNNKNRKDIYKMIDLIKEGMI